MEQDFILSDEYKKFIKKFLGFYIVISLLSSVIFSFGCAYSPVGDLSRQMSVSVPILSFLCTLFLVFNFEDVFKTKNKKKIKIFSSVLLFIVVISIFTLVGFRKNYFLYNWVSGNKTLYCIIMATNKTHGESWYQYAYECPRNVEEANKRKTALEKARLDRDYETLCKLENGSIYMDKNECVSLIKDTELQQKCVEQALKNGNAGADICYLF